MSQKTDTAKKNDYVDSTKLPFDEQINFFKAKLNLPTDSYLDLLGQDHDYAFVVAGANRNDLLTDFRTAVDKAINEGTTLAQFRKDFDKIVAQYGWDYNGGRNWRSRIIYDTNVYSSYSAGRYEQQQRMTKLRPYWQYRHRDGQKHPRPVHESWNDIVLPADDPWWQSHYPTNAYGCHCSVVAHSAKSLEREGLTVSKSPKINYVTKELGKNSGKPMIVTLPEGIDYGFDRIPGTNRVNTPSKLLLDKAISVPPKLTSNMVGNVLKVPEVAKLLNDGHKDWVDSIASGIKQALIESENIRSVGVIPESALKALEQQGIFPKTAVIAMTKGDLLHAVRQAKQTAGIAVPLNFWQNLPAYLLNPKVIAIDGNNANTLLYVFDTDKVKIAIKIDFEMKIKGEGKIEINIVRTGSLYKDVTAMQGFTVVYGSW